MKTQEELNEEIKKQLREKEAMEKKREDEKNRRSTIPLPFGE